MAIAGICGVCGRPAMRTCRLCGRIVCDACLDFRTGICLICLKKGDGASSNLSDGSSLSQ